MSHHTKPNTARSAPASQGRRHAVWTVAALLVAGGISAAAAPVSATPVASPDVSLVQVTCVGNETVTFSPGVTNTPGPVVNTTTQTFSPCLHVNGLHVTTWSGFAFGQSNRVASCLQLFGGGPGTRTIEWSNGHTSTWDYTTTTQIVEGNYVVVGTGAITDGLYEGALAQRELVLLGLVEGLAACNTPEGLTELSGAFTFTITGL